MTEIYQITTPSYILYSYIKAVKNRDDIIHKIQFGNDINKCSLVDVEVIERYAYLASFGAITDCAFNIQEKTFTVKKGDGTKEIFKAIVTFLFKKYDNLDGITFVDDTYITSEISKKHTSLKFIYLAIYGKSWYEYHFNAHLMCLENYTDNIGNLNYILEQPITLEFAKFKSRHLAEVTNSKQFEILETEFNRSKINKDSMRQLIKRLFKSYDCMVFDNWLENYVSSILNYPDYNQMLWVIFREAIIAHDDIISIHYKAIHHGGDGMQTLQVTGQASIYMKLDRLWSRHHNNYKMHNQSNVKSIIIK